MGLGVSNGNIEHNTSFYAISMSNQIEYWMRYKIILNQYPSLFISYSFEWDFMALLLCFIILLFSPANLLINECQAFCFHFFQLKRGSSAIFEEIVSSALSGFVTSVGILLYRQTWWLAMAVKGEIIA